MTTFGILVSINLFISSEIYTFRAHKPFNINSMDNILFGWFQLLLC